MSSATSIPSSSHPRESAGTGAGAPTGKKIKGVVSGIHGAGEQIRGRFNSAVDAAAHDVEGQTRDAAVFERGRDGMRSGRIADDEQVDNFSPVNPGAGTGIGGGGWVERVYEGDGGYGRVLARGNKWGKRGEEKGRKGM
ncbi:hypothetical protein C7212DRAFT_348082 [Tuber magnatum]|uniref:Uncharacterized protein n=1 Tax=Tuber magnatum TaxID=42249 RepID=A0A317SEP8_9PEZI|nr:hypothetical protein C7212DRAFT_348082 [Tuber magnatum]